MRFAVVFAVQVVVAVFTAISLSLVAAKSGFKESQCDVSTMGAICLFDGRKVILPDAVPRSMLAHWTFNEVAVIDSSGQKNHASNNIVPGPGLWGQGASAFFSGYDYVEIPNSSTLMKLSTEFTITGWLYFMDASPRPGDVNGNWCPLIFKGDESSQGGGPGLLVNTKTHKMKFQSLNSAKVDEVESHAKMPQQRWMHVGIVRSAASKTLSLYINGILDREQPVGNNVGVPTEHPLYLGAVPWLKSSGKCAVRANMDEVRVYARALSMNEIQAEAAPSLGGIPPFFLRMGCSACTVDNFSKSCVEDYHPCTQMELHAGGYLVARIMGYANWQTSIWTHADIEKAKGGAEKKLGLCCTDKL